MGLAAGISSAQRYELKPQSQAHRSCTWFSRCPGPAQHASITGAGWRHLPCSGSDPGCGPDCCCCSGCCSGCCCVRCSGCRSGCSSAGCSGCWSDWFHGCCVATARGAVETGRQCRSGAACSTPATLLSKPNSANSVCSSQAEPAPPRSPTMLRTLYLQGCPWCDVRAAVVITAAVASQSHLPVEALVATRPVLVQ